MKTGHALLAFTAAALCASALVGAACGGDESDSTDATDTPTAAASPAATRQTAATPAPGTPQGGTRASQRFGVPVTVTLDERWEVVVDNPDIVALEHRAGADGPAGFITFLLPEETYNPTESNLVLGPAPADFVAWFSNHRLIDVVSTKQVTLGGLTGTQLDVATDNFEGFDLLKTSDGNFHVQFRDRLTIVVLNRAERQVLVTYGSDHPSNFDAFERIAQPVLATVSFAE